LPCELDGDAGAFSGGGAVAQQRSTRRWRWRREFVQFVTLAAGERLEENAG
jgi:hypothetical protein